MTIDRRRFLELAGGAALAPALSHSAWAQAYPARPVQLVVPYPPGSGPDIIGRLTAQHLSERLGQQFIVRAPTPISAPNTSPKPSRTATRSCCRSRPTQ